jgi:hypothetical protein
MLHNLSGYTDIAIEEIKKLSRHELAELLRFSGYGDVREYSDLDTEDLRAEVKRLFDDDDITVEDIIGEI